MRAVEVLMAAGDEAQQQRHHDRQQRADDGLDHCPPTPSALKAAIGHRLAAAGPVARLCDLMAKPLPKPLQ
jgi:hypothetical protein